MSRADSSEMWNAAATFPVPVRMKVSQPDNHFATQLWIDTGAALFIVALTVSAVMVPQLRLLHTLQALIYVAVMVLTRRNSAWGFGAAFFIAVLWNSFSLFVTHLILVGAAAFWSLLRTGHVEQFVPMMVALGGLGHFILIIASVWALLRHNTENKKWWKFVGGGAAAIAYFVLIVAMARPR